MDFLSPVPEPSCEQHLWCKLMTFFSGYLCHWSEKQTGETKYDLDSILQRNDTIPALFVFVYFCLLLFFLYQPKVSFPGIKTVWFFTCVMTESLHPAGKIPV